ncbi:hypothetical protein SNE40_018452 [Patella caerulea]|uniref:Uncharacterized protein n=1 Tax=Patella caerulea TaxID=87958 RepID=A0AAN8PGJ0_PATCE
MKFLRDIGMQNDKLEFSDLDEIVGVGGESHNILGTIKLCLEIQNNMYCQSFHVMEHLHHPLILGVDFITKYELILNFKNRTVTLGHEIEKDLQLQKPSV